MAAEVALGHAGLVLGLEVSRLARNNVDWYRLLDLCGVTDTVIGDADGLYHPGSFNDRLLLGLKGTMSEAELHVLRARLEGGIRNKAARGELRRGLPVGLVWGEGDGEILLDPDEASAARSRRSSSASPSSARSRQVWLWMRREGVQFPLRRFAARRDPVGRPDLPPGPQRAREPRLRGRLRVRQDAPRALERRGLLGERDVVSEAFELGDEAFGLAFGVAVGEVVAAEVAVGLAGAEHVPDRADQSCA